MVQRFRLPHDRRAASVRLTTQGRELVDRLVPRAHPARHRRVRGARRGREAHALRHLPQARRRAGGGARVALPLPEGTQRISWAAHGPPPRRPEPVLPEARGAGARALARARRLRRVAAQPRGRRAAGSSGRDRRRPTASPGVHHVLARAFKDIYPRYKTMRGHLVERKGGWDCHGLPVEINVEQQLGLHNKHEIEAYGIAEFNAKCRASVFEYLEDWNRLTERIGFWVDLENAYRTLDATYVESVWWALRQIHDKGLLYEGHKVVPYCPRCGTALSSHELALGYKDVTDPSVYVRFPVAEDGGPVQAGDELLVWTTTPWTLGVQRGGRGRPGADLRAGQDGGAGGAGRPGRGAGATRARRRRRRADPRQVPRRGAGRRPLRPAVLLHQGLRVRRARPHGVVGGLRHRR